ncbi:MAG: 2,3-bisphosphoglycerate-independent phosphoglycerate mutase [Desulfuromonas sp.]|nr:MAG: 2,3-bisphosphoglycerate-independent phosphoglycerate mutase [Desulfuromonas sp.]
MTQGDRKRPVVLTILDGWGYNPACKNNAVCLANTPNLDALFARYPHVLIGASGHDVGLPEGQMGNSEVGHLNLGAGRIVYQDLTRIGLSIEDGSLFENPVLGTSLKKLKENGGKLHLIGLLSDGGVHSHNSHLYALVKMAADAGIDEICIHPFLDGRDTPPKSGINYLQQLENELSRIGSGRISTIIGRFYAMDRDNRWDRVERAYRAMTEGTENPAASSAEAITEAYAADQTDEFVEPRTIQNDNAPTGLVDDGDAIIFFNFRADRAREITRCFTEKDFTGFVRNKTPQLVDYVCLTEYDETFNLPVAFPPEQLTHILGEIIADAGMKQLRIAETEKYAHITFFFNGGREEPFVNEDRALIPSPQEVSTYYQKPAMSAVEVTDEMVRRVESANYDLIVLNFANPDMVGHTGILEAAVTAMETVDKSVGRVVEAVLAAGGELLITADHGNCEQMADQAGQPHTAHTTNPVSLLLVGHSDPVELKPGILADIAPTLLDLIGLDKPAEMTGKSLIS